ncbi:PREDICTED: putative L-ascorbate peroxidase 6 [Tarenaya hassleriana]|uniref:putative L-ascorbate peroxidase 6 n=1 Tax=Tarenaya hassleriana TaxID=28532 RepID=UPI00053C73AD|nr:PREDICTED: putative L-ascorbate peroxidase 6 [Tarenaya hassleriana]
MCISPNPICPLLPLHQPLHKGQKLSQVKLGICNEWVARWFLLSPALKMMTSSLYEPSPLWFNSSSVFNFEFDFPANWRPRSKGKFGGGSFRACRIRCSADDPGSRGVFLSSRRKMVTLFSAMQLVTQFLPQRGKADDLNSLMRDEIRKVVTKGKAAGVLRLVFHDAGTFELDESSGGMNGSIVYELERPENAGLKKSIKILEKAKTRLDAIQPVSWADMICVAGSEAVSICGGPTIPVALGRLDSSEPDPEGKLPPESLNALGLKECFQRKGFSTQELVALSGAHTLGSKGFGNPTVFDNSYYKILLEKPWSSSSKMGSMVGLPSDHALVEDDECLRWVKQYAENEDGFFRDFTDAYTKLVNAGAKWRKSL